MKFLTDIFKRNSMLGATVIKFDCDGCMAHDHKMVWIGEIIGTQACTSRNMTGFYEAHVRVLKKGNQAGDVRDGEYEQESLIIEDGAFQEIKPGLFFYYK